MASHTDNASRPAGLESSGIERRRAIKTLLGLGLAVGLPGCAGRQGPAPAGAPDSSGPPGPAAGHPLTAAPGAEHEHPAEGDRLVFAFGDREGQIIAPDDIRMGEPQVFAFPMDEDTSHIATESRLGQVMLVRFDPSHLSDDAAARAAEGILAYSAVCTHTGCEISDWEADSTRFRCPCHDSRFDPLDNGRAVNGPARRRLAALPLRIENGALIVAGGFSGQVGAVRREEFQSSIDGSEAQ